MEVMFSVPGEPVPKGRPRFTRTHAYTPAKTVEAEGLIGWLFKGHAKAWDKTGSFGVSLYFHLSQKYRRDLDNLVKTVLDGLNGVAWDDDNQVAEINAVKMACRGPGRTDIHVYRVESVDPVDDRQGRGKTRPRTAAPAPAELSQVRAVPASAGPGADVPDRGPHVPRRARGGREGAL